MGTFVLTDEQKDLQALAKEFADKEIRPISAEWDVIGDTPPELYKKAADMGFTSMALPEEFGGLGLNYHTQAIINEQLSMGDVGFANALGASQFACRPVLIAGTDEQKRYVVDTVINGGMASFALTEPNAGSDASALRTTAVKSGDEYILNGRKCFITNAPHAQFFCVFAKTAPEKGHRGISCFLVERDRVGVSVGKHEDKKMKKACSWMSWILMGIALLLAFGFNDIITVLSSGYTLWVAGGMVPFLFGRFWKKTTGVGALSSMFTGALFALLNMKGITHFPTSLFCLIPAAIVCVIVSLCTQKKEPAETKAE